MIRTIGGSAPEVIPVPMSISQEFDSFISADPRQLTENVNWGDVYYNKPDKSIRIYYQSIHGITSNNTWHKWEQSVV